VKLEAAKRKLQAGYQKVENGLYSFIRLYFYFQICSYDIIDCEVDIGS